MTAKNQRGRPRKVIPKLYLAGGDMATRHALSQRIAEALRIPQCGLTDALADAAGAFPTMEQLRNNAPLKVRRRGNRPNIHLAILLRDCALALKRYKGLDAEQELRRIGERTEAGSEVVICARAALIAIGINRPQSLRQQAKQAVGYL